MTFHITWLINFLALEGLFYLISLAIVALYEQQQAGIPLNWEQTKQSIETEDFIITMIFVNIAAVILFGIYTWAGNTTFVW